VKEVEHPAGNRFRMPSSDHPVSGFAVSFWAIHDASGQLIFLFYLNFNKFKPFPVFLVLYIPNQF
jgi:hypothetical protein